MSERPEGRVRRREGGVKNDRDALPLTPLPRRLVNPWKPLEVLSEEAVATIIEGACELLEDAGLEIRSARARAIYRAHGAEVDEASQMVRMDRGMVREFCAHAPESFTLHARNPAKNLDVGGDVINFGPVGGAPHVTDAERGRRHGDYESMCQIIKLNHSIGVLQWAGGLVVEPVDVPVEERAMRMSWAHLKYDDSCWAARGIGAAPVYEAAEMTAIARGISLDDLARSPSFFIVTNTNSPRRVDEELLDGTMAAAELGQATCVTPFTLAGAMAPITLAGALCQQTAEAMGVIALTQMVRRGVPVIYGGFTSNVDMRTGSPAFGTPEYVRATLAGGQIARALKLPYRTSAPNASPCVDAQAAYETSLSLFAAIMSHGNLVNHAAGWLESGLSASLEKIIIDSEILRSWAWSMQKIEVTKDDLALDAIKAVPPGGHFFGSPHTMSRFEHAFYRPLVSDWRNFETWRDAGSQTATQRATGLWKRILAQYQPPPMEVDVEAELLEFMAKRGLDTRVFR